MKIAIVTDSTAVLAEETMKADFLRVLNIPVIIDGVPQYDVPADEFYQRLNNAKEFPTTSQPSLGETLEVYEGLRDAGYDTVISIHISSGISGFFNTLSGIVSDVEGIRVIPFDSRSTSLPMGVMVDTAVELVKQGKDAEDILSALEQMREAQCIYLVVDDLHHLVRSGRLSNGAAIIGSLLKIKPILKFDDSGHIVVSEKIRTAKKAYRRTEELVQEELDFYQTQHWAPTLGIAHAGYEDKANELAEELSKKTGMPVRVVDLGTVIGTHTGAKTIGMGVMLDVLSMNDES